MNLIKLESVGCSICPCCGNTYPLSADGSANADISEAVHVSEVTEEWMNALSEFDRKIVKIIKRA